MMRLDQEFWPEVGVAQRTMFIAIEQNTTADRGCRHGSALTD
jgi:hypothetical protein